MFDESGLAAQLEKLVQNGLVRLERTAGVPTWEPMPGARHQKAIDRIRATITPILDTDGRQLCACVHLSDVLVKFPEGSYRRPDIAIFCSDPPDVDEALATIPLAVIEIVSAGYEYKDLALGAPFYIGQGVFDVIVHDPRSTLVTHFRAEGTQVYQSPVTVDLECGCRCVV
ncbi:MAG: Uma2 family endonuclease [Anaerolineae bacterium]